MRVLCGAFRTATGQRAATLGVEFLNAYTFSPAPSATHRLTRSDALLV